MHVRMYTGLPQVVGLVHFNNNNDNNNNNNNNDSNL